MFKMIRDDFIKLFCSDAPLELEDPDTDFSDGYIVSLSTGSVGAGLAAGGDFMDAVLGSSAASYGD